MTGPEGSDLGAINSRDDVRRGECQERPTSLIAEELAVSPGVLIEALRRRLDPGKYSASLSNETNLSPATSMDIAQVAKTRYTAKAFDPTKTVAPELIAQLRTVLRTSPSSVNCQPWHFFMAASAGAKPRIAKAMHGNYAYNEPKVRNASHVFVLCGKNDLDDAHLQAILAQEDRDGRFATPELMARQDKSRRFYVTLHQSQCNDECHWISRQVYLALGSLLLAAGAVNVDACPMEGFDATVLDKELGLSERRLTALVVVALGYHSADDFNAKLPKSRLPESAIFSEL